MAIRHAFFEATTIDKRLEKLKGVHIVYFLYDIEGNLIYIGHTKNIYSRLNDHKKGKEFHVVLGIVCEDKNEADNLEKDRIRRYKPFFNKRLYQGF